MDSASNKRSLYEKECESIYCINYITCYDDKKCYDCHNLEKLYNTFIPLKKMKKNTEDLNHKYDAKSNVLICKLHSDVKNSIIEPEPKMFSLEFLQKFYDMQV